MFTKMMIRLTREERDALVSLARSEMRPVREHARWLLVSEARHAGLLPEAETDQSNQEKANEHAAAAR